MQEKSIAECFAECISCHGFDFPYTRHGGIGDGKWCLPQIDIFFSHPLVSRDLLFNRGLLEDA